MQKINPDKLNLILKEGGLLLKDNQDQDMRIRLVLVVENMETAEAAIKCFSNMSKYKGLEDCVPPSTRIFVEGVDTDCKNLLNFLEGARSGSIAFVFEEDAESVSNNPVWKNFQPADFNVALVWPMRPEGEEETVEVPEGTVFH